MHVSVLFPRSWVVLSKIWKISNVQPVLRIWAVRLRSPWLVMRNMRRNVWRIRPRSTLLLICKNIFRVVNMKCCLLMLACRMVVWLEQSLVIMRCWLNVTVCCVLQRKVTRRLSTLIPVSVPCVAMCRPLWMQRWRGYRSRKPIWTVKRAVIPVVSVMPRLRNVSLWALPASRKSRQVFIWCYFKNVRRMPSLWQLLQIMPR